MRVLHVPYTYFPEASGGTEIYVASLCAELARLGIESRVAAPSPQAARYCHDGVEVHRFAVMAAPGIDQAWKAADPVAADQFSQVLDRYEPEIVHLHARTAAVSSALVDRARDHGARVVLTYHSPTMSCARGTMLHGGSEPCDGQVRTSRCVRCALGGLGVPGPLAALAGTPIGVAASRLGRGRLRIPGLVDRTVGDFHEVLGKVDHVVAVCEWVRDVLLRNGASPERLTLCRQGVATALPAVPVLPPAISGEPLRIAYYGRLDPTKGVELLVEAVLAVPTARVVLDMFVVAQSGSVELAALRARCARDGRIDLRPGLAPSEVVQSMAGYDLIAVPSSGMETGPLVVLEAQAAGVPALGAKRGGIAELVRHGVDGMLVPPDDVSAWTGAIERLADDRELVEQLRRNVRPPRTMAEAATEMAEVYRKVLGSTNAQVRKLHHPTGADAAVR
jgi:glycosyltransferase involved in cell wall biosynthesis